MKKAEKREGIAGGSCGNSTAQSHRAAVSFNKLFSCVLAGYNYLTTPGGRWKVIMAVTETRERISGHPPGRFI
jgi:hypothetical protein